MDWIDCELLFLMGSLMSCVPPWSLRNADLPSWPAWAPEPVRRHPCHHNGGCDPRCATVAGAASGRIPWQSSCHLFPTPPCQRSCCRAPSTDPTAVGPFDSIASGYHATPGARASVAAARRKTARLVVLTRKGGQVYLPVISEHRQLPSQHQ